MIGLEKEIRSRRGCKKSTSNQKFSISYIAKLLDTPYSTMQKRIVRNSITIIDAFAIFKSIVPQEQQTLDFFEYLFTEQN